MEKWQIIFMIGSGVYLLLMGIIMAKHKDALGRRSIGIYNIVVGLLSIIGAVIGYFVKEIGSKIFLGFVVVLIVSFIIFMVLNKANKKK